MYTSTNRQSNSIIGSPQDVLLRCVAEYLRKQDLLKLFSLCRTWQPLLYQCRSIHIKTDESKKGNQSVIPNSWHLFKTSEQHRTKLLSVCGSPRPLQLTIQFDELESSCALLREYVQHFSQIAVTYKENSVFTQRSYLPSDTMLTAPSEEALLRYLKSGWHREHNIGTLQNMFRVAQEVCLKLSTDTNCVTEIKPASFSSLRGLHRLVARNDCKLFVEVSPDGDARLHTVVLDYCENLEDVTELQGMQEVLLLYCFNLRDVSPLAHTDTVVLAGLTLTDTSMLGRVRKLVLTGCEVEVYPVPSVGKDQEWEFSYMDIVDVSSLASLEKLKLHQCRNVIDISMLGSVRKLVVTICHAVTMFPVPSLGKGQEWVFTYMNISDVSGLASLESLSLTECPEVTDISMLGHVTYLRINNCHMLNTDAQFPSPLGKYQNWTFAGIDMINVSLGKFGGLHTLQLRCSKCLRLTGIKNISELEVFACTLQDEAVSNISVGILKIHIVSYVSFGEEVNIANLQFRWNENQPLIVLLSASARANLQSLQVIGVCNTIIIELFMEDLVSTEAVVINTDRTRQLHTSSTRSTYVFTNGSLRTAVWLWFEDDIKATQLYGDISNWNVSQVTDMSSLFQQKETFNCNIDAWDVRNVTNMSFMFMRTASFNQPLNSWNVSNVIKMGHVFKFAFSFNQPLDSWNVSNVMNMHHMFFGATSFFQPLDSWNVSNVTNMSCMFEDASLFNQPLHSWNVSNVIDMNHMFYGASVFNQPLQNWNVSNVTNMSYMFGATSSFNQPLDGWNVSNAIDLSNMFHGSSKFNQPLASWNVSKVVNFSNMVNGASSFNQPISSWDVRYATDMRGMFYKATSFNQPVNSWDVGNVTNLSFMFKGATSFNQPLDSWDVSNVGEMGNMFYGGSSFNQSLDSWNVSNVTKMNHMFKEAILFNQPLQSWNVRKVRTLSSMFTNASSFNQPLANWNLGYLSITFSHMFQGATSFNQPLNSWDVSNPWDMNHMFKGATSFNQPLDSWNMSDVRKMEYMFQGATSFNQPLKRWNKKVM